MNDEKNNIYRSEAFISSFCRFHPIMKRAVVAHFPREEKEMNISTNIPTDIAKGIDMMTEMLKTAANAQIALQTKMMKANVTANIAESTGIGRNLDVEV